MRRSTAFAFAASSALAQVPANKATNLARGWAPPHSTSICRPQGRRGEFLPPNARYCTWLTPAGSHLGALVFSLPQSPSLVTWERRADDPSDAKRIVDSLGKALVRRGLKAHRCPPVGAQGDRRTGMLWEQPGLAVKLDFADVAGGDAMPLLVIMATDAAEGMPKLITDMCRGDRR
jgi:hypothetical protein